MTRSKYISYVQGMYLEKADSSSMPTGKKVSLEDGGSHQHGSRNSSLESYSQKYISDPSPVQPSHR